MDKTKNKSLLKDERVLEEIGRHRWIESEKLGCDIGFEQASADWLNKYSEAWLKTNQVKKPKAAGRSAKRV